MFRPIRALKAMTAAGALALAAAPAPASAASLLVEGDNAVAIDFTLRNVPYYLFIFSLLNTAMTGFDGGDTYELNVYDKDGVLLGTTTNPQFFTEERIPPVTPPLRPGAPVDVSGIGVADLRAVLKATGGSSFHFDDGYDVTNIFAQIHDEATREITRRRTGDRPLEPGRISALNLAAAPVGGVPEPGAWALMILGFGAVGAALRRRTAAVRT